jgi:hypothetical protein
MDPTELIPDNVKGWTDRSLALTYARAADSLPEGSTFVEVGSWMGKSIILMHRLLRGKRIRLICVDHFLGSPAEQNHLDTASQNGGSVRHIFNQNLDEHKIPWKSFSSSPPTKTCVEVIHQHSALAAHLFPDQSIDFVFIDAAHTEDAVRADITAWLPKVKPGGTIAGHDWHYQSVQNAVKSLLSFEVFEGCWHHLTAT